MSLRQLVLENTLPSAPATTRAIPTRLSSYGSVFAYGSGNNVVVRNLDNPSDTVLCGLHSAPVTAVRISPTGRLIASGDQNGTVIVWVRDGDPREVLNSKQLQGPVRDIGWTADEERLVVAGEGKSIFAVAITITANSIGSINGHAQNIMSCDMRGERPYRIVTGGTDAQVGFYEGVPFKFKSNVKSHTNTVTCVRYSPDMEVIASVSSASDIILYDGKTGEKKSTIATGHTGTVYSVAWSPDGSKIVSASADKSVKIFDAVTGLLIGSCALGSAIANMQQGVTFTHHGILSVSLDGALTLLSAQGEVQRVMRGHQGRILLVHSEPDGTLVTVGVDQALVWPGADRSSPRAVPLASDVICAAAFGAGHLYFATGGGGLWRCSLAGGEVQVASATKEAANTAAIAVTGANCVVLLSRSAFSVIDPAGAKTAEVKLDRFDGASAAAHGDTVALGGEKIVKLYRVASGAAPELCLEFAGRHTGTVSCVAISHDGERIASGDAGRNIFVWAARDGSVLYEGLVFHTLRVTSLAFSPSNSDQLLSGSMDASIIFWDLGAKRRKTQDAAHRGGVSAVAWSESGALLSGGSDFCVRQWRAED